MPTIQLEIDEIPEGHGLSFKKGISSALLNEDLSADLPNGHDKSYSRGQEIGSSLKEEVAKFVKK